MVYLVIEIKSRLVFYPLAILCAPTDITVYHSAYYFNILLLLWEAKAGFLLYKILNTELKIITLNYPEDKITTKNASW